MLVDAPGQCSTLLHRLCDASFNAKFLLKALLFMYTCWKFSCTSWYIARYLPHLLSLLGPLAMQQEKLRMLGEQTAVEAADPSL